MTKVKDFFRKIDDKVLGVLNDAYLWMLDWTGVYVATVLFACCAPSFAYLWNGPTSRWMIGIWFFLLMGMTTQMYWTQNQSKTAFNVQAEMNKSGYVRVFFIVLNITNTLIELFDRASVLAITVSISSVLFWYIICIKIRDREKKKFEFKVPGLAHDTHA